MESSPVELVQTQDDLGKNRLNFFNAERNPGVFPDRQEPVQGKTLQIFPEKKGRAAVLTERINLDQMGMPDFIPGRGFFLETVDDRGVISSRRIRFRTKDRRVPRSWTL